MPTIRRIVWVDFTASLLVRGLVVLWAFSLLGLAAEHLAPWPDVAATGARGARTLGAFAAFYSVGAVPALVWRITGIRGVFRAGRTVSGKLTELDVVRGRAILGWSYIADGKALEGRQTVKTTDQVRAMKPGDPVEIAIDPARPERSFLVPVYC